MKSGIRGVFRKNRFVFGFLLLFLVSSFMFAVAIAPERIGIHVGVGREASTPHSGVEVFGQRYSAPNRPQEAPSAGRAYQAAQALDCSTSGLGTILLTEQTSGESTCPYTVELARDGYTGMVGSPTYEEAAECFPQLQAWDRVLVCNSHDCLSARAERAVDEGLDYEYLGYGPERLGGVPDDEKYNLPWATQVASEIADQWGQRLMLSYSTKQLHQEAEERGYDWNDPSAVVSMLAPYGDLWLIQAADEYWRLDDGTVRPILSQRVYPPGPEFRAEVERWTNWIRAANPDIEVWIQLALQRIGVPGETDPSAELALAYRQSVADLVDGIYLMPIYGSVEQLPAANQAMEEVFRCACGGQCAPSATPSPTSPPVAPAQIALVEEGWSDDLALPCPPSGVCPTILPGYYYRIYENLDLPCGSEGNHEFLVLDRGPDAVSPKHLFVKFLGGGVGFWYLDAGSDRVYYPNERAVGVLTASQNRNMFFRTSLSEEFANGVTKRFRENDGFRVLVVSYCSHDLYHGSGEHDDVDGFSRWGYLAGMQAVDHVQQHFATDRIITYGGSAGAAGAFYVGKDQDGVAGIVMDSQAVDLSAIRDACYDGYNVFGSSYPCFCPEGGPACMEVLAPRIGFTLGSDEPYRFVEQGFHKPLYFVWNERDASIHAHLQFDNLHQTIEQFNPGGMSVARMVCITDPETPPGPTCNLHVPSAYDYSETASLVEDIYNWALSLPPATDSADGTTMFLPLAYNARDENAWLGADCSQSSFGTMLVHGQPDDRITPADVLIYANDHPGVKGLAGTGAPSDQVRDEWFAELPGWTRLFMRGTYTDLEHVHEAASTFGLATMYECLGYGPESAHQAGEEALDPVTWVPRAEGLAEAAGKCLVYGPAVLDYERLATPQGEDEPQDELLADLIAQVAPHVDIWVIQLAKYQNWVDSGRDDHGDPYGMDDLATWLTWWVSRIKDSNPQVQVWTQLGVGRFDPLQQMCLPPQPPEYILDYRDTLAATGVDGIWIMPSMPCQQSANAQDHEYYLQSLETFQEALTIACQ